MTPLTAPGAAATIRRVRESDGTGRAGRLGSALTWRPQTRTASLLIGGFFLYFVLVALRSVPDLVTEVLGKCLGPADFSGYACQEPSWARGLAAVDLVMIAAELAVVAGAALAFLGRSAGRSLLLGALAVFAAAEIVVIAVIPSPLPGDGLATTWQPGISVVASLILCGVVASLRD